MIQLENLQEFTAGIEAWIFECEELADHTFRGLAISALSYIVQGSPEWSGNIASSWRLTVGAPASGYSPSVYKGLSPSGAVGAEPYSKLSPNSGAIAMAISLAKENARFTRLGEDIYITNNAPYAQAVESNRDKTGKPFLRAVNLPVEMVHAAFDKFSGLGEISESRAADFIKLAL